MSCNRSETKISRTGSMKAGISTLSSKAGSVAGVIAGNVTRASDTVTGAIGKTVAPTSNRVLKAIDRPTTVAANLLPALAGAAAVTQVRVATTGPGQGRRPAVAVAVAMRDLPDMAGKLRARQKVQRGLGVAALAGGVLAATAAELTEQPQGKRKLTQSRKTFLVGEQQVEVTFAKSKLTGWLNKRNALVSAGNVVSSQGDLVHYGQGVWHRGTTVVKLPEGRRTITQVQKLGLPPTSHYFEQALSDEAVASLVSGQSKPHKMTGYVGTIGAMENLAPGWAQVKRAMILTRLHWPNGEKPAAQWVKAEPVEPVVMKPLPRKGQKVESKMANERIGE